MLCICWPIKQLKICKCIHTNTHAYTSTAHADTITLTLFSLNKKEILSFGIIQMNQAIMLNGPNHTQEDSNHFTSVWNLKFKLRSTEESGVC